MDEYREGKPTASGPTEAPRSLLEGVEEAVCAALRIRSTGHRSALKNLCLSADCDLVEITFGVVAHNYARGNAAANRDRSRENWRWQRLQPQISEHNSSQEVVVERAIAAACCRQRRTDWANQVPVASGLVPGARDGRRAIDLVHRDMEGGFELIELKMDSDTPLYAAIEIIGYGCLWLLARANPPAVASEILQAESLALTVLAPASFYAEYDLVALETALDRGCKLLGKAHGTRLSFSFRILDERLRSPKHLNDQALLAAIDNRLPMT